eukprot:3277965-Karenia_brevis.AAC.1
MRGPSKSPHQIWNSQVCQEAQGGEVQVIPEESGVGESELNPVVERSIWEVESLARTLVHSAEENHGVEFELRHPIREWAIECAGQLLNRGQKS